MSRVGKLPVKIPEGVTVTVSDDNVVQVKGPKGELRQKIDPRIQVEVRDNSVEMIRSSEGETGTCPARSLPFAGK